MVTRTGLRIRVQKVDNQVANHFKLLAKWLRLKLEFPVRIPVYLSEKKFVISKDGEQCISIFFAPYDSQIEPYISIATSLRGQYPLLTYYAIIQFLKSNIMPRKPRFFVAGVPNHVIQRGNNKEAVFFEEEDHRKYLTILNEAASKQGVKIHAYVLMTNHIHLLATADTANGISQMMQQVGRLYVPYVNFKYKRTGTLWEGRFKSSLVSDDIYVLACMRYIEMNPVRAHMVKAPQDYKWSSYHSNVRGAYDPLIVEHISYKGLAKSRKKQQENYRDLFLEHLDEKTLNDIRKCAQTGTPLGNNKFKKQIESKLKIKVGYNARGRPKKCDDN